MFDLTGKTALVTGSTQGIGFAIAKCLSEHGAKVFVHGASNMEKCKKASEQIINSIPVCADFLKLDDIEDLYQKTGDSNRMEVPVFALNASIQYKRKWNDFTMEEYDIQMNCNLKSSYLLIKMYSKAMREKGWGRIVTLGSVNQYNQHPELSLYGVSKVAQLKMVQNIAPQLAPDGVIMLLPEQ